MTTVPHDIEWTPEKSKRLWDYYGSDPKFANQFFGYIAGRLVARMLFAKVRAPSDARFLDFSCGYGDMIAACFKHMRGTQEIHATDFSPNLVRHVSDRFARQPRFKGAMLSTSLPCPFPQGLFDVVFATEVIEHLVDHELDAMLTECRRLLKPGGQVFFTTPNNEDYDAAKVFCPECGCIYHRWQHVRIWTADTLRTYMERAGFVTRLITPVAWLNWRGKLWSLLRRGRLDTNGLVYIGETTS